MADWRKDEKTKERQKHWEQHFLQSLADVLR